MFKESCTVLQMQCVFYMFLSTFLSVSGIQAVDEPISILRVPAKKIGESLYLQCRYADYIVGLKIEDPSGKVHDFKPKTAEPAPGFHIFPLFVTNLTRAADGVYTCTGHHKSNATVIFEANQTVTVYEPLSFLSTETEVVFEPGTDGVIPCIVAGSPKGTIDWHRGNLDFSFNQSRRIFVNSVTLSLTFRGISKSDEGVYTCRAMESKYSQIKQRDVAVYVQYAPKRVDISPDIHTMFTHNITLRCYARADPPSTYSWYHGEIGGNRTNEPVTEGLHDGGRQLTLESVVQANTGKYTCVASNVRGSSSNTTFVRVPASIKSLGNVTVKEGDPTAIRCIATGYPEPYIKFYRNSKVQNSNVRTYSTPEGARVSVLEPSAATPKDADAYTCKATNSGGSSAAAVSLHVLYAPRRPRVQSLHACPNQSVQLSCHFDAYPPAEIAWKKLKSNPETEAEFSSKEEKTTSLLQVSRVSEEAYGTYLCTGSNSEGNDSAEVDLLKPTPPSAPRIIKVLDVSTDGASVVFSPSTKHQKVAITGYVLRERITNKKREDVPIPLSQITRLFPDSMRYHLRQLRHNTTYVISIAAVNCMGKGRQSKIQSFTTKAKLPPNPVKVTSPETSPAADNYTISWVERGGGGRSEKITLTVAKMTAVNGVEKEKVMSTYVITKGHVALRNRSLFMGNLTASSRYRVYLSSSNEAGSGTELFSFKTAAAPPSGDDQRKEKSGNPSLLAVVMIIIVVVICLFLAVDIYFCQSHHCGLIFTVSSFLCPSCLSSQQKEVPGCEKESVKNRPGSKPEEETPLTVNKPNGKCANGPSADEVTSHENQC